MPFQHYWPLSEDDKCRSIKFAVDWGNSHRQKVTTFDSEGFDFAIRIKKSEVSCTTVQAYSRILTVVLLLASSAIIALNALNENIKGKICCEVIFWSKNLCGIQCVQSFVSFLFLVGLNG